MQIVSTGDHLQEMSNFVFWENKKNITLSSVDLASKILFFFFRENKVYFLKQ